MALYNCHIRHKKTQKLYWPDLYKRIPGIDSNAKPRHDNFTALSPVGAIDGSPPVHWRVIRTNPLWSPVGTIDGSPPVHWRVIRPNPLWSPVGTIECPPISTVPTGRVSRSDSQLSQHIKL